MVIVEIEVVVVVLVVVLESEAAAAVVGAGIALAGTAGLAASEGAAASFAYAGPEAIGTFPGNEPTGLRTFSETNAAGSVMLQLP